MAKNIPLIPVTKNAAQPNVAPAVAPQGVSIAQVIANGQKELRDAMAVLARAGSLLDGLAEEIYSRENALIKLRTPPNE